MTHAHDDIRVGAVRLPWLKEKNGWLLPWGEVVTNPLKAQRLAEELNEKQVAAHQRGAKVVISNSTAPRVIELYEQHGFTLHRVSARRAISSKGSTRETASDVVATLGVQ